LHCELRHLFMQTDHLFNARWGGANAKLIHRIAKELGDAAQREVPGEETIHGHPVGSNQRARSGASSATGL
jgi:hypothetical protein